MDGWMDRWMNGRARQPQVREQGCETRKITKETK